MNLDFLYNSYKGGGRASYHPKMMLKVILYAYTQKIYTSLETNTGFRPLNLIADAGYGSTYKFRT